MGGPGVRRAEWTGWELLDAGPADAAHTALLLPGAQCTAEFYADVLADPRPAERSVRLVAATPPGFGGRRPPPTVGIDTYVALTAAFVEHLGCDVVVGHSYFANVVIELAATGRFEGPIVLLSPAFSRQDEELGVRLLGLASRVPVLGALPWVVAGRALGPVMEGRLPRHEHGRLVAEMRRSDWRVSRRLTRDYLDHLVREEQRGSLAARLVAAGVPTWVVRGDHDEIGLTDEERRTLAASGHVTVVNVADAGHFVLTDQPAAVVDVILAAVATIVADPRP